MVLKSIWKVFRWMRPLIESLLTPLVGIDKIDSFIKSVDFHGDQDWAEDFFLVTSHVWLGTGNNCWSNKITLFET